MSLCMSHLCLCEIAGYFCVYNSKSGLSHIRRSLENLPGENRLLDLPARGMPVVIVLGHNPDVDERTLALLREGGQLLADRY